MVKRKLTFWKKKKKSGQLGSSEFTIGVMKLLEVQVVAVKVENGVLFYKGKENGEVDEDWQTMAVEDDVVSATIDSVYTAVYLTLED